MKTIEQAAIECANIYLQGYRDSCTVDENDFIDVFESGVEFATKWISVDEELPRIGEKVITKMNKDKRTSYGIATLIIEIVSEGLEGRKAILEAYPDVVITSLIKL